MNLVCDIFLLHKCNYVCKWSVIVSLLKHILSTITLHKKCHQLFVRAILFWFGLCSLAWVGLDWIWTDKLWKPVLLSTRVSVSLNFISLEATSKIFSTDAISTINITLNVGLTLDLDTFQLSWMYLGEYGLYLITYRLAGYDNSIAFQRKWNTEFHLFCPVPWGGSIITISYP